MLVLVASGRALTISGDIYWSQPPAHAPLFMREGNDKFNVTLFF